MDKDLRLSAPWLTYTNEVKALFGEDPDIKIVYSDDEPTLILMINGEEKAEAIAKLLPTEKVFGNVIAKPLTETQYFLTLKQLVTVLFLAALATLFLRKKLFSSITTTLLM